MDRTVPSSGCEGIIPSRVEKVLSNPSEEVAADLGNAAIRRGQAEQGIRPCAVGWQKWRRSVSDVVMCWKTGSSVHGILQARLLEWVAISFSWGSSQLRDGTWVKNKEINGFYCAVCTKTYVLSSRKEPAYFIFCAYLSPPLLPAY
ncbi:hypothetical protein R6Z07F_018862 [Ovis aries]